MDRPTAKPRRYRWFPNGCQARNLQGHEHMGNERQAPRHRNRDQGQGLGHTEEVASYKIPGEGVCPQGTLS